ncbi:MAG: hypothetical protein ACKVQJ_07050 [Pyrinomonadaceae bacterium]
MNTATRQHEKAKFIKGLAKKMPTEVSYEKNKTQCELCGVPFSFFGVAARGVSNAEPFKSRILAGDRVCFPDA